MISTLLLGSGLLFSAFGAVKLGASVTVLAQFIGVQLRAKKAVRTANLELPSNLEELQVLVIPVGAIPGLPEVSGPWMLSPAEKERLDSAIQTRLDGYVSHDLEQLLRTRDARFADPALSLLTAAQVAQMQKATA